jgi:hypothetical protein
MSFAQPNARVLTNAELKKQIKGPGILKRKNMLGALGLGRLAR